MFPTAVKIVEVGPRDGLQNEAQTVSTKFKTELIQRLIAAGIKTIEAGAFVSPKWVPQMADSVEVFKSLPTHADISYPMLVPNQRGLDTALELGVTEIAVFAAASNTFSQKNINCNILESMHRFRPICAQAIAAGLRVRGYISCVLGCPYEGEINPILVADVAERLLHFGCYEISLGDTIGIGTAEKSRELIRVVTRNNPVEKFAAHFHNTYGQALANLYAVLEQGVAVVDSSISGLGGCPYAKGASGNVATEDIVYMLDGLGIQTGINLNSLVTTSAFVSAHLQRAPESKVALALLAKQK